MHWKVRATYSIMEPMNPSANKPDRPSGTFTLTRSEIIALVFFFVLALAYAVWQYFVDRQSKVDLGRDISAGGIVVQVVGAVESPDLVFLPEGARVSDAIEAAGGFTSDADRSAVNLAAPVVDGQRIEVPYADQSSGTTYRSGNEIRINRPGSTSGDGDSSGEVSWPVNINSAGAYELQSLPGIGEQLAQRIIDYRMQHGPFARIEDITNVDGIGQSKFEEIRDKITVAD
jgi:competence protein ComEA